jgi:hypothetical protein
MPRRRSLETMEKDAQAADLYRRGLTYRQISAQMGWASPNASVQSVRRAAKDAARDSLATAEALQMMLARQQDYRRAAYRVLAAKHYVVTQAGGLAHGPDRQPLVDDGPVLAALDRLVKIDDAEAKLLGLYAPAKSRVEIITEDAVDAELKRLAKEITAADEATAADLAAAGADD